MGGGHSKPSRLVEKVAMEHIQKLESHYSRSSIFSIIYLILFLIMLIISGLVYYKQTPEGKYDDNVELDTNLSCQILMSFLGFGVVLSIFKIVYYWWFMK